MARIRSTHPGQWTDGEFLACSPLARLLILSLRNEADDNGIFRWNEVEIKIRCLPLDNVDIGQLLQEAIEHNQLLKYEVLGRQYGVIRNFQKWQKPKSPTFNHPIPTEPLPKGYEISGVYSGRNGERIRNSYGNMLPEGEESSEEKRRGEEGNGDKPPSSTTRKEFTPPDLDTLITYFTDNGFSKEAGKKAHEFYTRLGWRDSNDKKVKNWKTKMRSVWFKDENKIVNEPDPFRGAI